MEAAIEAGAEDVESDEDGHVIWCADTDLAEVSAALEAQLGEAEHASWSGGRRPRPRSSSRRRRA